MKNKFEKLMVAMSYMDIYGNWDKKELKYDAKFIGVVIIVSILLFLIKEQL